jgi:hypothetical protein
MTPTSSAKSADVVDAAFRCRPDYVVVAASLTERLQCNRTCASSVLKGQQDMASSKTTKTMTRLFGPRLPDAD